MIVSVIRKTFSSAAHTVIDSLESLTKFTQSPKGTPLEETSGFEQLVKSIENRESLVIRKNGTWYKNRWIVALFRKIIRKDEAIFTARQLSQYLSKPPLIKSANFQGFAPQSTLSPLQIDRLVAAVRNSLGPRITLEDKSLADAKTNRDILKGSGQFSEAELVEFSRTSFDKSLFPAWTALAELQRTQISSFYLGQFQKTIEETSSEPQDPEWVRQKLIEWQDRTFPSINFLEGVYEEGSLEKINRCCKYKKFIEAARYNPLLLDFFFYAVFRNSPRESVESVDIFLQAPTVQAELHRSYIDTRITHIRNKGLQLEEHVDLSGRIVKDVTLLISGTRQSIVDPSKMVTISEKVSMTVQKLFDTFKKGLDRGFIEYEYLQETGITAFDGRCTQLDLTKKDWWKDLPVVERLTRKEVSEKYDTDFSKGHSLFILRASRKYPDLHAQDCHSWIDLVIPLEDGTFNSISIGKFSTSFPIGNFEALQHVFKAHPAEITLIDPNKFYTWRQRVHYALPSMEEEDFDRCMEKIRTDLIRCRERKMYFEAQGSNCAKWVEDTLKTVYPQWKLPLFNTHYYEMLTPPLTPLLRLGNTFRIIACVLLGAWRGVDFLNEDGTKQTVRLIRHPEWRKGILRIPGRICEKDRAEEIIKEIEGIRKERNIQPLPKQFYEKNRAVELKKEIEELGQDQGWRLAAPPITA